MRMQIRYPPFPVERRMIHVSFRETLPTAWMTDMKAKADGLLTGTKCEHATATYFSMQQFG